MVVEFYYSTALTPEHYEQIHLLGYGWVTSKDRYSLLMRSIVRSGACFEDALPSLENPLNQKSYKHGPDAREGWLMERNCGEMKSDGEDMRMHDRWLGIWAGAIKW